MITDKPGDNSSLPIELPVEKGKKGFHILPERKKPQPKTKLPYVLQPENAIGNLAKRMSGAEPFTVIKIHDRGGALELCDMNKIGDWLYDPIKEERFMVQHKSVDLEIKLRDIGQPRYMKIYLVDSSCATTVELVNPEKQLEVEGVWIGQQRIGEVKVPESIAGYTLKGTTMELIPDEIMEKFRASPQMWASYMDNHDAADTYAPPNNIGAIIISYIFGVACGGCLIGIIGVVIGLIGGHL